jgi:ELWxxDGT repeat protein
MSGSADDALGGWKLAMRTPMSLGRLTRIVAAACTLGAGAEAQEPILVEDIRPGAVSSVPLGLTHVGGTLFFSANDGTTGQELWKSDGTEAGTVRVRDIVPGSGGSYPGGPFGHNMQRVNGALFFVCMYPGRELWKTDGTEAGTVRVKGFRESYVWSMAGANGLLFFTADDGTHGLELWKSDGTEGGTVLVKDINPGLAGASPSAVVDVDGMLYFAADDGTHGAELWRSDGTGAGTVLVKDISPGSAGASPSWLAELNGMLYFAADDGTHGSELWRSDGTEAGTVLVKDVFPGPWGSGPWVYSASVGGVLFFTAEQSYLDRELWTSDGTEAGTARVKDICPGQSSTRTGPAGLVAMGGAVFFSADDCHSGRELWRSDGTAAGTARLKDISPGEAGSSPDLITDVDGVLHFLADDGIHGLELWRSDGTETGTVLVGDIYPGGADALGRDLASVGRALYFVADDGVHGRELWRVFGTPGLSIGRAAVAEGDSGTVEMVFTVTLPAPRAETATVDYATADGTATAGSDYVATSGTLTFAPGETSRPVVVAVNGDTLFEADETLLVQLSPVIGIPTNETRGVGTITNDDTAPALSIDDVAVAEGDAGTTEAVFTVSLSSPAGLAATVAYTTADGWATAGSDYTATSGLLTFAPGVTSQTTTALVLGDTAFEGDETFFLNLSGPANVTIADGQGLATILDDDPPPPALGFHTVPPCRLIDTRTADPTFGGPALVANADRTFPLFGPCGIPTTARALSVNLTVTQPTAQGNLRLYPGGTILPLVSTINYVAGQTRANNAIAPLNGLGELAVRCSQPSGTAHFILDVNGYFE